jgi:hypothetical protein
MPIPSPDEAPAPWEDLWEQDCGRPLREPDLTYAPDYVKEAVAKAKVRMAAFKPKPEE